MTMERDQNNQPIGKCFVCQAPIYAGEPRRGVWRVLLPPRVVRTCVCFDMIRYGIQQSLMMGAPMPSTLVMMPRREDE